jgi:hypothetical protein
MIIFIIYCIKLLVRYAQDFEKVRKEGYNNGSVEYCLVTFYHSASGRNETSTPQKY